MSEQTASAVVYILGAVFTGAVQTRLIKPRNPFEHMIAMQLAALAAVIWPVFWLGYFGFKLGELFSNEGT